MITCIIIFTETVPHSASAESGYVSPFTAGLQHVSSLQEGTWGQQRNCRATKN